MAEGPALETLHRDECLRLLESQQVGRLGFVVGDQPMILPVNYGVLYGDLVFRTDRQSPLHIPSGAKVAFEADGIDATTETGWSVLVQGVADEITDVEHWFAETLRETSTVPWAPGEKGTYIRIRPRSITGRRIVPA